MANGIVLGEATNKDYFKKVIALRQMRKPIDPKCNHFSKDDKPCDHIDGKLCNVFIDPPAKWRLGVCNMATHAKAGQQQNVTEKVRVGQQKQKRKSRK